MWYVYLCVTMKCVNIVILFGIIDKKFENEVGEEGENASESSV